MKMKGSALLLAASLLAAQASLVLSAKAVAGTRSGLAVALDPGWWKATAPSPSAAIAKRNTSNATAVQQRGQPPAVETAAAPQAVPVSQLAEMLHSNEVGVQALEKEVSSIHARLSSAENGNVAAAGNVSLAESGIHKLAAKAQDDASALQALTVRVAMSGSSLDRLETQLRGSEMQVRSAAKSAKQSVAIAKETATPQALQSQDMLNDNIWKLMDPSSSASLDAAERQVSAMEKDTRKFGGLLAKEVKTEMASKLQGSVRSLREAVHKLGGAGNKLRDGALGEMHSAAPLGADVGLDDG